MEVHSHAAKAELASDWRVGSALVLCIHAKSGSVHNGRLELDHRRDERNVISWTVIIGGLAQHGRGKEDALQLMQLL